MSKITNDGLTRSGTGCFIAVPIWHSGRQRVKEVWLVERIKIIPATSEYWTWFWCSCGACSPSVQSNRGHVLSAVSHTDAYSEGIHQEGTLMPAAAISNRLQYDTIQEFKAVD